MAYEVMCGLSHTVAGLLLFWHAPLDISLDRERFWVTSTASFSVRL